MSTCTVSIFQPRDPSREATVIFNGQFRRSVGRLDDIGGSVMAAGFTYESERCGMLFVAIQCMRTSENAVRAELAFMNKAGRLVGVMPIEEIALAEGSPAPVGGQRRDDGKRRHGGPQS